VSLFDENIKKIPIGKKWLFLDFDLDPHSSKSLDPDPDRHIMNADPKHVYIR
jgi:hypothetical protein